MQGYVPVKDGAIFYTIQGKGPWLVLVHGAWTNHKWWRFIIPTLSRHFRILCFDLRGHGKSTKLQTPYSVKGFASDLDAIMSYFEIDECVLIGWSLGGCIAMQYCIDAPKKVKALVLISTRSKKDFKMMLEILLFKYLARLHVVSFEEQIIKRFHMMFLPKTPTKIVDWATQELLRASKDFFLIADSFLNWKLSGELRDIKIPSLIITGDKDALVPKKFSAKIQKELPSGKLVVLKNCSHVAILDRSKETCKAIQEFLGNI
jgi:pimeloyl-ACP methyl ester carboxylesterase